MSTILWRKASRKKISNMNLKLDTMKSLFIKTTKSTMPILTNLPFYLVKELMIHLAMEFLVSKIFVNIQILMIFIFFCMVHLLMILIFSLITNYIFYVHVLKNLCLFNTKMEEVFCPIMCCVILLKVTIGGGSSSKSNLR